jgi:hypothetical protein
VAVASGADWVLAKTNLLDAGSSLQVGGALTVAGGLSVSGAVTIEAGGVLTTGAAGLVETAGGLTMTGGTLTVSAGGQIAIGTTLTGDDGRITVGPDYPEGSEGISGFGVVSGGPIADNSIISANAGTLVLQGAVSGAGTLSIGSGATLMVAGAIAMQPVIFAMEGNAALVIGAPAQDHGINEYFGAGDTIDLLNLAATSARYQNNTLTVLNGNHTACQLVFSGSYQLADFALSQDGHGGTEISFAEAGAHSNLPDFAPALSMPGDTWVRDGAMSNSWNHRPDSASEGMIWSVLHRV